MVTLSKYKVLLRYVAVIAVCLIGIHNFYFQPDSYWETKNHNEAIALFSGTTFDPRASVYDTLSYIQSIQNGKDSTFGDSDGIHFHWDDWVDLSPGDVVLNEYRLAYPDGDLDEKLEKFASVNPYYMELYNTKVLRSTAYTYSLQSIPDRVVIMTDDDLIEVAVSGKKRLGITKNSRYSKAKVLKKLVNVNSNKGTPDGNKTITWHPFKEFNKTMIIDNEQFVFNPEVEIMKLRTKLATQSSLSPSESDYLKTLEYGNGIVESTDKYFKYPWIYSDLVRGQAHHLESSFFRRFISTRERQSVVHHMSRAWFEFANTNGIVSWINYGSLLGWVYNGLNMPWDTDVDIQIPIRQLLELARNFNRTLVIENPKYGNGKYYLEISPTYVRQGNGKNFIDGRFIEVNSGLYIDISALARTTYEAPKNLFDGLTPLQVKLYIPVNCKNFNWQLIEEISPIKYATFEGGASYIPHQVSRILDRKYGRESYTTKEKFHNHNYQGDLNMWVPDRICSKPPNMHTDDRFTNRDTKELTLEGACGSIELQDEYRIMFESSQRHILLEDDQDLPVDYDIKKQGNLPIFRKDSWDYYRDIIEGQVDHDRWYVREN